MQLTKPLRVAIADDEPINGLYFRTLIERMGHQVVGTVQSGRDLVSLCDDTLPDLVLTDVRMPGMDGIEAAGEICSHRTTPIILVSAYHDPELISMVEGNFIYAYLVKPVKPEDLEMAVALAFSQPTSTGREKHTPPRDTERLPAGLRPQTNQTLAGDGDGV